MSAPPPMAIPPTEVIAIKKYIGGQVAAIVIMLVLQGMCFSSLFHYLDVYRKEPRLRYLLVFPLFGVALFQSIQLCVDTYSMFVGVVDDPLSVFGIGWVIKSSPVVIGFCTALSQGFFARRISLLLPYRIIDAWFLFSIPGGLIAAVIQTYAVFQLPSDYGQMPVWQAKWDPVFIWMSVLNIAADFSITACSLWTIYTGKNKLDSAAPKGWFQKTSRVIATSMAAPFICQVLSVSFHLGLGGLNTLERTPYFAQTKLATLAVLQTLLSRGDLRKVVCMCNADYDLEFLTANNALLAKGDEVNLDDIPGHKVMIQRATTGDSDASVTGMNSKWAGQRSYPEGAPLNGTGSNGSETGLGIKTIPY